MPLSVNCSNCGAAVLSNVARFCTRCGRPICASGDHGRRSVGSIFRSLVGFIKAVTRGRASSGYTWRGRHGTVRASGSSGSGRGRARPEVFKVRGLSRSAKRVYFYLSRVSDAEGNAIPFVRTIAARTGLSKSAVALALNDLERGGFLTRTHRYSRRGGSSSVYHLRQLQ